MRYKFLLLLMLASVGCVHVSTGGHLPTFGEQISDLVSANERGLLSDDEFQQLRGELIRSFGR